MLARLPTIGLGHRCHFTPQTGAECSEGSRAATRDYKGGMENL